MKDLKELREELRRLGFGNQAVIVGTKRVELYDWIEHRLLKAREEGRKEILLEWETAIYYSELDKGKLSQEVMENHLKRLTHKKGKV